MRIVQLTPGTGSYHSGAALRDHTLVTALRRLGHHVSFVPLCRPILTDEEEDWRTPLFFDDVQVYRHQALGPVRRLKSWLCRPAQIARQFERLTPGERGDLAISLLKGEHGRHRLELAALVAWLRREPPELVSLSNALLLGLAPRLKREFRVPIICSLQGELRQLAGLPPNRRDSIRQLVAAAAFHVDAFIAPSQAYAQAAREALALPGDKLHVIANGIALNYYSVAPAAPAQPTIGFLGRLCEANGLALLLQAFVTLKQANAIPDLQLRLAGAMSDTDLRFLGRQMQPLPPAIARDIKFLRNINLHRKVALLQSLSVLCVPAADEGFGLYLLEAMAVGVPVVQPRHGPFAEIVEKTAGGVLCEPGDAASLAAALAALIQDEPRRQRLGRAGRQAVLEHYSVEKMAGELLAIVDRLRATPA